MVSCSDKLAVHSCLLLYPQRRDAKLWEQVVLRDVEAEAGSGPFSVEAEARKFYSFRFHIGYLT